MYINKYKYGWRGYEDVRKDIIAANLVDVVAGRTFGADTTSYAAVEKYIADIIKKGTERYYLFTVSNLGYGTSETHYQSFILIYYRSFKEKNGKSLYNIEAIVKVQKIAEKYGYTTQFIHNKDGEAVCFAIDAILE